jgi:hypothetical protein
LWGGKCRRQLDGLEQPRFGLTWTLKFDQDGAEQHQQVDISRISLERASAMSSAYFAGTNQQ